MNATLRKVLKTSVNTVVETISRRLPGQLGANSLPALPAVPPYRLPLPCNAWQLPTPYLVRFGQELSLAARKLYLLQNVQVSWHGVVFHNLQLFRPSVAPVSLEPEFSGSFLLRQWWKRSARKLSSGEVLALAHGPWAVGNYYHWMVDTLPRLLVLQQYYPNCLLLVPAGMPSYVAKTAAMLGFHHLLPLSEGEIVTVPQLVMPMYTAYPSYQDPALMRSVQQIILDTVSVRTPLTTRRLYVSRVRQRQRRLLNEVAIEPLLQRYGFETVFFEDLTFEQQVQLLYEADILVGVHGAGLTNALFMRPRTTVVEFMSEISFNPCYYHLASGLELNYYHVPCRSADQGEQANNHSDLEIDPAMLEQILSTLFTTL